MIPLLYPVSSKYPIKVDLQFLDGICSIPSRDIKPERARRCRHYQQVECRCCTAHRYKKNGTIGLPRQVVPLGLAQQPLVTQRLKFYFDILSTYLPLLL